MLLKTRYITNTHTILNSEVVNNNTRWLRRVLSETSTQSNLLGRCDSNGRTMILALDFTSKQTLYDIHKHSFDLIWFDFTWFLHYYHQLWLNMCKYVCKEKRSVEFKIATYLHTHFEKIKKTSFEGRQTHTHSNTLIFMIHEFAIHTPKPLTVFHPHIWVDLSEQGRLVVVSGQWSCSKIISMWCQRKSLYANTFLLLGKLNKLNGNRMDFMSSIRWVKATISCCLLTQGKQFFFNDLWLNVAFWWYRWWLVTGKSQLNKSKQHHLLLSCSAHSMYT